MLTQKLHQHLNKDFLKKEKAKLFLFLFDILRDMIIEKNKSLKDMNTFMVDVSACLFARVDSVKKLHGIMELESWGTAKKHLVLGGGSNVLFSKDYDGFMLKNEIMGIQVSQENEDEVIFRVGAGESWHDFVMFTVERDLWGIENLALIPGMVGASPVQNIGAYGSQVSDVIVDVDYVSLQDGVSHKKNNLECNFSYRDSWFKQNPQENFITHVSFRLFKKRKANTSYGRLSEKLDEKGILNPSPLQMAELVIDIRQTKLPAVGEVGMAGSFFKNPVVSAAAYNSLNKKFPDIKAFPVEEGYKIPAGWILEKIGCRGAWKGNVGNYEKHALVVVHNGKGTGQEVLDYVHELISKVQNEFGINLEPEVNIF